MRRKWFGFLFLLVAALSLTSLGTASLPQFVSAGERAARLHSGKNAADAVREPYVPPIGECRVNGLESPLEFTSGTLHYFTPVGASAADHYQTLMEGDGAWVPEYWAMSLNPEPEQQQKLWRIRSVAGVYNRSASYPIYIFFRLRLWNGKTWVATDRVEAYASRFTAACITPVPTPVPATPSPTPVPVKLTVTPARQTLYLIPTRSGSRVTLRPVVRGMTGTFTYSSSNPAAAKVNKYGVVTAVDRGTAVITTKVKGSSGGKTVTLMAKTRITVKKPAFTLKQSELTVKQGSSRSLKGLVKKAVPQGKIYFSSSNPKVAKVTASGVLKGIKKGRAGIRLKCNGITRTIKVTVK